MRWLSTRQPYHYCTGVRLKKGKGCFDGKVYYEPLKEVVLAAVQTEARKVFDISKRCKQAVRHDSAEKGILLMDKALTGINPKDDHTIHPYNFFDGAIL